MNWELWGPPLVALGVGLIGGAVVVLRARGGHSGLAEQAAAEDLQAKKAQLIEQLKQLDADREKMPDAAWQADRDALLVQAADVLRRMEAPAPAVAAAPPVSRGRALAWALAVPLCALAFGYVVVRYATPRPEGGSMTGGSATEGVPKAADPALEAAKAAYAQNPSDLAALNVVTYDALLNRDFERSMALIEEARALNAKDADVQIHIAVLQLAVGMVDKAVLSLDESLAQRPQSGRAWLWMSLARLQSGQREQAQEAVAKALSLELRGDETAFARSIEAELKKPAAAPGATASGGGATAGAAAMAVGEGSVTRFAGSVRLADGKAVSGQKVLFVTVYRNAQGTPPPVSSKRLDPNQVPTAIRFTENDLLMGGEWPEQVWVRARLDADGAPGAGPGDLDSPLVGPITLGQEGVELILGG
jgi:tetratricopeptide (TPR) repeat protein